MVKEYKVALGDKVKEGSIVLVLETAGDDVAPETAPDSEPKEAVAQAAPAQAAPVSVAAQTSAAAGRIEVFVPDIGDFNPNFPLAPISNGSH